VKCRQASSKALTEMWQAQLIASFQVACMSRLQRLLPHTLLCHTRMLYIRSLLLHRCMHTMSPTATPGRRSFPEPDIFFSQVPGSGSRRGSPIPASISHSALALASVSTASLRYGVHTFPIAAAPPSFAGVENESATMTSGFTGAEPSHISAACLLHCFFLQ
jgi:hypothetical protein